MAPQTNLFIFGDPRILQIIQEKYFCFFLMFMFANLKRLQIPNIETFGKTAAENQEDSA